MIRAPHSKYGTLWSREELVLAFYLYCQIPFSKTKANNPDVVKLSKLIGRTPSSVARKLGNFGAFDPRLSAEGITGLTHYSKADFEIWTEFHQNWEQLLTESRRLLTAMNVKEVPWSYDEKVLAIGTNVPTERVSTVVTRLKQGFFRRAVLSSYNYSCCVCGIDLPQLLTASHIIPWSSRKETRIDPHNGLSLCALHDRAFDRGILAISPSYKIQIASVADTSKSEFTQISVMNFAGKYIHLPSRFTPKAEFLAWRVHNLPLLSLESERHDG